MGVEDDLKRLDEKQKAALLQMEKRLVNLESGITELQSSITAGNLTQQQEQRVAAVEERLENTEDLEMLNRLDVIKIKEAIGKGEIGVSAAHPADLMTQRRLDDLESALRNLNEKVSDFDTSKIKELKGIVDRAEKSGAGSSLKDINALREDFDSFKKETEESVEKIVLSIKKFAEKL